MGGECFGKCEEDGQSSPLCPQEHGRDVLLPRAHSGRHFMEVLPAGLMVSHMKIFLEMENIS